MNVLPLHVAMKEKKMSLGMFSHGEMMGVMAAAGFNHIMMDHMFSPLDWAATNALCTSARRYGIAPIIRVQTYPWSPDGGDMHAVSEVARVRKNGAAGAVVSIGSVAQLRAIMRVPTDLEHCGLANYRLPEIYKKGGWSAVLQQLPPDLQDFPVVAYIEKVDLIKDLEEIVEVEGLRAIGLGIHDICYSAGHPFEVEHPKVWQIIDQVVKAARPRGISVWTNTGYIFTKTDETVDRIRRLYDRGVDTIQVQHPAQFLEPILKQISQKAFALVN